jgi:hypothetical protein
MADLLAALAAAAILAALALAATRQMRQEAMNAAGLNQLRWIAGATSSYAADNADLFWAFSWTKDNLPHSDPTLPTRVASDRDATAVQAVHILRRRAYPEMPRVPAWTPQMLYHHLPLVDYLDADLPSFHMIAPHDRHRLRWARDPAAFAEGAFLPFQPEPTIASQRWVYSWSYDLPPAFFDQSAPFARVYQHSSSRFFIIGQESRLQAWRVAEVTFPAQKVHVLDRAGTAPGSGRQFALFESSRTPVLMADGSAGHITTADTNPGWHPHRPPSEVPSRMGHDPSSWEPGPSGIATGHYRWTRGGILGRDTGGPEIDTGQP